MVQNCERQIKYAECLKTSIGLWSDLGAMEKCCLSLRDGYWCHFVFVWQQLL